MGFLDFFRSNQVPVDTDHGDPLLYAQVIDYGKHALANAGWLRSSSSELIVVQNDNGFFKDIYQTTQDNPMYASLQQQSPEEFLMMGGIVFLLGGIYATFTAKVFQRPLLRDYTTVWSRFTTLGPHGCVMNFLSRAQGPHLYNSFDDVLFDSLAPIMKTNNASSIVASESKYKAIAKALYHIGCGVGAYYI